MSTKIQWTDETANWIVGCTKVSAGCLHCYAETASGTGRLQQFPQYQTVVDGKGNWNGNIEFVPKVLDDLLKGNRKRRVFAPSMSDPFHPNVKDEWRDKFFAVVALTPHIQYQVLTKRAKEMHEYFTATHGELTHDLGRKTILGRNLKIENQMMWRKNCPDEGLQHWPLPNLHLGVSVENQAVADERIPWLLDLVHIGFTGFLSAEPLLEEIDISRWTHLRACPQHPEERKHGWGHLECDCREWFEKHVAEGKMPKLSQVIVGGESGKGARPFNLDSARSLHNQCKEAGIKFFMKQAGSNVWDGDRQLKLRDRKGGDLMELPEDLRIREIL